MSYSLIKKTLLTAGMLLILSSVTIACPFCLPTGTDILTVSLDSNVVALVKRVDGNQYKIVEVLRGSFPVGRIVIGGEDVDLPEEGDRFYKILSTTVNPNRPFWTEPVRNINKKELTFLRNCLQANSTEDISVIAAKNLESTSPVIAEAAYNFLTPLSVSQVQKVRHLMGRDRLINWIRDKKILSERRSLYLFMVMPDLRKEDLNWLKQELIQAKQVPGTKCLPALMVAIAEVGGPSAVKDMEGLLLRPESTPTNSSDTISGFSYIGSNSSHPPTKQAARSVFRRELQHPERGLFAITYLGEWRDFSVATQVERIAYQNPSTPWVISSATRYFRSFTDPKAQQALLRLKKRFPQKVDLNIAPYKKV